MTAETQERNARKGTGDMAEYKTERQDIPLVASTLAAAIIAQHHDITSPEAAVALYEKIAAQIYGISPYAAAKSS
jgi:hypothetical protein